MGLPAARTHRRAIGRLAFVFLEAAAGKRAKHALNRIRAVVVRAQRRERRTRQRRVLVEDVQFCMHESTKQPASTLPRSHRGQHVASTRQAHGLISGTEVIPVARLAADPSTCSRPADRALRTRRLISVSCDGFRSAGCACLADSIRRERHVGRLEKSRVAVHRCFAFTVRRLSRRLRFKARHAVAGLRAAAPSIRRNGCSSGFKFGRHAL